MKEGPGGTQWVVFFSFSAQVHEGGTVNPNKAWKLGVMNYNCAALFLPRAGGGGILGGCGGVVEG